MRRSWVLLMLLAGCTVVPSGDLGLDPAPLPVPTVAPGRAAALLDTLVVHARPRPDGSYRREAFGDPWADVDGNGCNQRDDVLLRDARPGTAVVAPQGRCDHDVLAGVWVDPYTGETLELTDLKDPVQSRAVQIDHVVPLAEAWASGAAGWDDERRRRYGNDLAGLVAADGAGNAAKGADDPAAWRPVRAFQCSYAVRWIATKDRWALAVDPSEAAALREMLGTC